MTKTEEIKLDKDGRNKDDKLDKKRAEIINSSKRYEGRNKEKRSTTTRPNYEGRLMMRRPNLLKARKPTLRGSN